MSDEPRKYHPSKFSPFVSRGNCQRVYEQLHEATDEIARLKKALNDVYNVPWTSSGRGELSTQTHYSIALAHKDRIVREALELDTPDEDQPPAQPPENGRGTQG